MKTFLVLAGLMYAGLSVAEAQLRVQYQQGNCPNGNCPTVQQPFAPQYAPVQQAGGVEYRSPVGHTHTCPRCGLTWDHQANPTHTCQRCGAQQFVVDTVPRPVAVFVQRSVQPMIQPAPVPTQTTAVHWRG